MNLNLNAIAPAIVQASFNCLPYTPMALSRQRSTMIDYLMPCTACGIFKT